MLARRLLALALPAVLAAAERGESIDGVVEGPRPAIPSADPGTFEDGVDAERALRRTFGIGPDSCELGPYIEDDAAGERAGTFGRLGGGPRPIAFDGGFWLWFSRLTPERRDVLLWVASHFRDVRGEVGGLLTMCLPTINSGKQEES